MREYDELQNSMNIIRDNIKGLYCEEDKLINIIDTNRKGLELTNDRINNIRNEINRINGLNITSNISKVSLIITFIMTSLCLVNLASIFTTLLTSGLFLTSGITLCGCLAKLDKMNLSNKEKLSKKIIKLEKELENLEIKASEFNNEIAFANYALSDNRKLLDAKKMAESNIKEEIFKSNYATEFNINNKTLVKKR